MAVVVHTKRGKQITLLNPDEKKRKYKAELESGIRFTNDGQPKVDSNGCVQPLTEGQRTYRSGYVSAAIDAQKAYHHKKGNKKSKQNNALVAVELVPTKKSKKNGWY